MKNVILISYALISIGFVKIFIQSIIARDIVIDDISLVIIIIGALPYYISKWIIYKRKEDYERNFPKFLRDLIDTIHSGMPLPTAIRYLSGMRYGLLSKELRRISIEMSMGKSFDEALKRFAERSYSRHIQRGVDIIVEANKLGANIIPVLKQVADYISTMKSIELELKTSLRGQLITVYISFVAFLVVVILLIKFLLTSELFGNVPQIVKYLYHLALINGFFAGLVAGRIAEASIVAGLKHSLILLVMTIIVFKFV